MPFPEAERARLQEWAVADDRIPLSNIWEELRHRNIPINFDELNHALGNQGPLLHILVRKHDLDGAEALLKAQYSKKNFPRVVWMSIVGVVVAAFFFKIMSMTERFLDACRNEIFMLSSTRANTRLDFKDIFIYFILAIFFASLILSKQLTIPLLMPPEINQRNAEGQTPWMIANTPGFEDMAALLQTYGANPMPRDQANLPHTVGPPRPF